MIIDTVRQCQERWPRLGRRDCGTPMARWTDDTVKTARQTWMRMASIKGEGYAQQCVSKG